MISVASIASPKVKWPGLTRFRKRLPSLCTLQFSRMHAPSFRITNTSSSIKADETGKQSSPTRTHGFNLAMAFNTRKDDLVSSCGQHRLPGCVLWSCDECFHDRKKKGANKTCAGHIQSDKGPILNSSVSRLGNQSGQPHPSSPASGFHGPFVTAWPGEVLHRYTSPVPTT